MRFRFTALLVLALSALPLTSAWAQANTAQGMYTAALARERGLRDAAKPPTLQQVRAGIAAYEAIVRRFPRSGYSDNALWQGGNLAILAYERFGQAADQQRAIRLLNSLKKEYPSSSLVPRVDSAIRLAQNAKSSPPPARATPAQPPARATAALSPPAPAAKEAPAASAPAPKTPATAPAESSRLATLRNITRRPITGGVRVIIELDREAAYRAERIENPARIFFDLEGTEPVVSLKDATIRADGDIVREIRLGRHPQSTTRVVLDAEGVDDYSVFALYEPFRLVVDFKASAPGGGSSPVVPAVASAASSAAVPPSPAAHPGPRTPEPEPRIEAPELKPLPTKPAAPLAAPELPSANANGKYSLARQLGLGISRIVIDAGHGGRDPGTMANGLRESELVLDVAKRLAALLRKQTDIEVVMTRETDVFIELEERTAIANREDADLFLSIHANSARNLQARGIETYFLNFATNPEAEAVAARENASSSRQMHHLPDIVRAIALNNKINESRDFADTIQRAMVQRLSTRSQHVTDRGVKQAPFVVLIGAEMPSVLAEISFLTNKQDAALLKTSAFRQQIAQALFDGILKYQQLVKKARSPNTTASAR